MSNKNYMGNWRLKGIIGSEYRKGNDGVFAAVSEAMERGDDVDDLFRRLNTYHGVSYPVLEEYKRRAENIKRLNADVYLEC